MVQELYALIMQEKFEQAEELANEISVNESVLGLFLLACRG